MLYPLFPILSGVFVKSMYADESALVHAINSAGLSYRARIYPHYAGLTKQQVISDLCFSLLSIAFLNCQLTSHRVFTFSFQFFFSLLEFSFVMPAPPLFYI